MYREQCLETILGIYTLVSFYIYKIDEEFGFMKIYILANFTLCKYIYHSSTALTIVYLQSI